MPVRYVINASPRVVFTACSGPVTVEEMLQNAKRLSTDSDFDSTFSELIDLHRDLTDAQSALVNARLILLLSNHIGDFHVLREAMRIAREDAA